MCKMCPTMYMIILINKDKHMTYKNKRERERETCKESKRDI